MGALEDKVVVITGASRGLGEAMAVGYAAEGAQVVLSARTESDLERVGAACKQAGARGVAIVRADIAVEEDVRNLVETAVASHGKIDAFVANAATSYAMLTDKHYRELTTYDADIVEHLFRVNAIGMWLCMKHALPAMPEGSSFIAIGSETGRALYPGAGIYAITKASVDALAKLASREFPNIRVNVLSPGGMVDTQLFGPAGMPEWLKQQHPPLPLDVIVPAAIWLASDASNGVSGGLISAKDFNARGADAIAAEISAGS